MTSSVRPDLLRAADSGDLQVLKKILSQDGENLVRLEMVDLALCGAAEHGHCDCVRLLVEHGADVRRDSSDVLHLAAKQGETECVSLLLHLGADIHSDSDLALRLAAKNGHADCVSLLLDRGADHFVATQLAESHLVPAQSALAIRAFFDAEMLKQESSGAPAPDEEPDRHSISRKPFI